MVYIVLVLIEYLPDIFSFIHKDDINIKDNLIVLQLYILSLHKCLNYKKLLNLFVNLLSEKQKVKLNNTLLNKRIEHNT